MEGPVLVTMIVLIGLSTILWATAGAARYLRPVLSASPRATRAMFFRPSEVAVLIAAHNEELVIADAIAAAAAQVPRRNIFVVSDGSTDRTAAVAEASGATALALHPNRGKAGAIRAGLEALMIAERFPVVLLLDADTRLRHDYLATGLPLFDAPDVVAVAGRATTSPHGARTRTGRLLTAYRERFYVCTQYLHKYGQASRWANAVAIVPGFASMYRTDVLHRIDIDAPGLAIEDFNMTFEVHAKKLGRIAFHPGCAVAETQDPVTLADYVRQMRRWTLGFWQTVRRHGAHRGLFWAAVALFIAELVLASILLALTPIAVAVAAAAAAAGGLSSLFGVAIPVSAALPLLILLAGFLIVDVLFTLIAAALTRRPPSPWAVLFPFVRMLDALVCLHTLVRAFGRPSDGRWRSPARRATEPRTTDAAHPVLLSFGRVQHRDQVRA